MSVPIRDFLKARRDRALGTVLGYAEREVKHLLTRDEWERFRSVALGAIDTYHDSVLDIVKSEDNVRNEEVLELLRSLESSLNGR